MKTSAAKACQNPSHPIEPAILSRCASISSAHARNAAAATDKATGINIGVDF